MRSERQNLGLRPSDKVEALVAQFAKLTLDLVFPLHCLGCQREGTFICAECVGGLKPLERPYCDKCAQPNSGPTCAGCLERPLAVDTIRAPFCSKALSGKRFTGSNTGGNGPPPLN